MGVASGLSDPNRDEQDGIRGEFYSFIGSIIYCPCGFGQVILLCASTSSLISKDSIMYNSD